MVQKFGNFFSTDCKCCSELNMNMILEQDTVDTYKTDKKAYMYLNSLQLDLEKLLQEVVK